MATPAGQVTNAVLGFTNMLIRLLREEQPDAIAVAWDLRGPNLRKEKYPEYKAQRDAPPDIFASQLPLIREVLEVLLDEGEPVRNVPASFDQQGQEVIEVKKVDDHNSVRVRRSK